MKLTYCPNCHKVCKIVQETSECLMSDFGEVFNIQDDKFTCTCGNSNCMSTNTINSDDFIGEMIFRVKP